MYTALFLIQALLHLILFVWLLRIWRTSRSRGALVLFVPEIGLIYDNLIVASGSYIGLGDVLTALSWPRFWIHWACGAWLIIAAGSALRAAGIRWVQSRPGMAVFCLVTVLMMGLDARHFVSARLQPVCEHGLVRNSTAVSPDKFCLPDQIAVAASFPTAALVTCVVVIVAGAVLMVRRRFPWTFLGGVVMLATAIPPLKALKLDNLGEVLIAGGLIWAIARFAPPHHAAAPAAQA